ncbi:MAG: hypothetical protein WEC75_02260 [Dehalococcoidia bacterium]
MSAQRVARILAIASLVGVIAVACSENGTNRGPLTAAEIDALKQSFLSSSFEATYDVQVLNDRRNGQSVDLRITKAGPNMRIEAWFRDYDDEPVYSITNVETGEDEVECGVRTLESGEVICFVQDDRAWAIEFVVVYPLLAALSSPEEWAAPISISLSESRFIAGIDATCYDLTMQDEEFPPAQFCVGSGGEVLHQSWDLSAFTAREIRHDIEEKDVEIPYRLVYESDLPTIDP